MKIKLIILILLLNFVNLIAQPLRSIEDRKYFIGNVLSSGLITSINACINKSPNQSIGKVIINSFWKGCLGGTLNYGSKKIIEESSYKNTYSYIWPGKVIHSIGSSIIYNGSKNKNILSSFNIDILIFNINISNKLNCRIDPLTTGYAINLLFNKDFNFNIKNSIYTGSMFFDKKSDDIIIDGGETDLFKTSGEAFGNTIWRKVCKQYYYDFYKHEIKIDNQIYNKVKVNKSIVNWDIQTVCHELIHTMQYSEFNSINSLYIDKINKKLIKNIYLNINFGIIYYIANINGYNNNYFEKEANHFGKSNYYNINSTYHY